MGDRPFNEAALIKSDRDREAHMAQASANLLAALWREHPKQMRWMFMLGRAERNETPANDDKIGIVENRPPLFGRQLVQEVADLFDVSYGELIGDGRSREFIHPRAVVTRVLRARGWSYPRIGQLLGNRDHTTVMNADDKFDIYVRQNPIIGEATRLLIRTYLGDEL